VHSTAFFFLGKYQQSTSAQQHLINTVQGSATIDKRFSKKKYSGAKNVLLE